MPTVANIFGSVNLNGVGTDIATIVTACLVLALIVFGVKSVVALMSMKQDVESKEKNEVDKQGRFKPFGNYRKGFYE